MSHLAPNVTAVHKPAGFYAAMIVFWLATALLVLPWTIFNETQLGRAAANWQRVAAFAKLGLKSWFDYDYYERVRGNPYHSVHGSIALVFAAVLLLWIVSGMAVLRFLRISTLARDALTALLFAATAIGTWHYCTDWQGSGNDTMATKTIHMSGVVLIPGFSMWLYLTLCGKAPATTLGLAGLLLAAMALGFATLDSFWVDLDVVCLWLLLDLNFSAGQFLSLSGFQ